MRHQIHKAKSIDDVLKVSISHSVNRRLPWLILGLIGGIVASGIIGNFEEVLSENLYLAAFIPLIVYMSDAVGTQMEAFAIRDLALHQRLKLRKYFIKQLLITLVIASIISSLLMLYSSTTQPDFQMALTISSAIFFAIISSIFTGILIPFFILKQLKVDPANASGPVATIIQDLISITIYFLLASHFLH